MAAKQSTKTGGFDPATLANPGRGNTGELFKAALYKVDSSGKIIVDPKGVFKLNPSAFSESKSANWVQNQIPGQSDPVFQWVSSGARTLTFDAFVTRDTSDFTVNSAEIHQSRAKVNTIKEKIATLAFKMFKVQVPPVREQESIKDSDILDISDILDYYRSLLYPTYSDPNGKGVPQRLQSSPPLLVLIAGSGLAKLPYSNRITNKHDVWVLTDIRINITKQRPNLDPMEAMVSFTLVQYNIRSFDANRFHQSGDYG